MTTSADDVTTDEPAVAEPSDAAIESEASTVAQPRGTTWVVILVVTVIATIAATFLIWRHVSTTVVYGLWLLGALAAVGTALRAALDHRTSGRSAWVFFALGAAFIFGGQSAKALLVLQSFTALPGTEGWLFTTIGLALLALGCLELARIQGLHEASGWVDALIVLFVGLLISYEYIIEGVVANESITGTQTLALTVTPVLLSVLLATTARVWLVTGKQASTSSRLVVGALFLLVLAGFLSIWWTSNFTVSQGGVAAFTATVPVLYPFEAMALPFFGLLAAAAMHPTVRMRKDEAQATGVISQSRLAMLLGLAATVAILLFVANPNPNPKTTDRLIYAIGTGLIFALIGFRIWRVVGEFRHSLHREKILSDTASDLAGSTSVEEAIAASTVMLRDLTRDQDASVNLDWDGKVTFWGNFPDDDDLMKTAIDSLRSMTQQQVDRLDLLAKVVAARTSEQLDTLLENASDVIMLVDKDGVVSGATQSVERVSGDAPQNLVGKPWAVLIDPPERADASRTLDPDAPGSPHRKRFRIANFTPEVEYVECLTKALPDGESYIVTLRDVTAWERSERRLIFEVLHDSLTKLYNRAGFRSRLEAALVKSHNDGTNFAVLLLDLDDFKNVNDSLGHPAGDELLRVIADRIRSTLRADDAAARLGGDEFGVVLDDIPTPTFGRSIAERILEALSEPVMLGSTAVVVSASIGVVSATPNSTTSEALERDADLALYEAKNAGKNQYAEYMSDMHDEAVRRLTMTTDLRRGLEEGTLVPFFQPIVDLDGTGIAGVEALVRWHHPERGWVPAEEFIPIAEESGLVAQIDTMMLEQSLRWLAHWQHTIPAHKDLTLTINVSSRRMLAADFVHHLRTVLAETRVAPETVILEITETVLMPGEGAPLQRLYSLANLGLRLYVDDFGTGWSSLTYLRTLPVHGIKLARDFVLELPDPQAMSLVRSIKDLVVTLGLGESVAEGIENETQRQALRELGYHLGQGWYFSRPLAPRSVTELLQTARSASWDAPTALMRQEAFESPTFDDFDDFSGMSPR